MYKGNKNIAGYREQIKSVVKPHDMFIELFAGSAAVSHFLSTPPAKTWLNDLWPGAVEHFVYSGHGMKITHFDAIDLLQSFLATPAGSKLLFFADPPYLHSTRPNSTEIYVNEPDNDWHVRFLECIQNYPHDIILTHPDCDLYSKYLAHWNSKTVKVRYHNKTSVERIYYNFPEPVELFDYTSCGQNRTDRQRIKRQVNNFIRKLEDMPALQRNHILELINSNFADAKKTA